MQDDLTIPRLLHQRVLDQPDNPALYWKVDGEFIHATWFEIGDKVARAATLLKSLGVEPGDHVFSVSENRWEWLVCDLAIGWIGAVHVPAHATLTGAQLATQVEHCNPKALLFSTRSQAEKRCVDDTSSRELVCFEGAEDSPSFERRCSELDESLVQDVWQNPAPLTSQSLATILYTSGTTGEPKGVMLSQGNLISNTVASLEIYKLGPDDMRLCFLPLSHIFARTCDAYTWLMSGSQLALAESRETIIADAQATSPHTFSGVPHFFSRVYDGLKKAGLADQRGVLRGLLGGRIRYCVSGGASLPLDVYDFFVQQEVPILQGYGMTECSPVITSTPVGESKRASVGKSMPGVEVRIRETSEIITRGPNVMMGYYRDDSATNEVIRDGWLHTGDLGYLDDDGHLFITGRAKEIIVTSAGKNIAPVYLESLLTADPLIAQAFIVGDDQKHLAAVIVPDFDALNSKVEIERDAVANSAAANSIYRECINACLADVSHHEQVRQFYLLNREFTVESGELTPKLTLRREVIGQNLATEISALFD